MTALLEQHSREAGWTGSRVTWYGLDGLDNIKLIEEIITQLDSVKYLGVVIDNRLKWDKHITDVTKRVSFNNYRLRMLRHILPRDVLWQIFKATSIPIVDYASSV